MGGYGGYVWPAYISSAVVLGAIAGLIWRRRRRLRKQLDRLGTAEGQNLESTIDQSP